MAYFLQTLLPGDWALRLAFVELLVWVAMFSLIFLGKHENKDQIARLTAEVSDRDRQIAALNEKLTETAGQI